MKDVFENAKKHNSLPKSQPKVYCRPEELAELFENHFNSNFQNFETPEPLKITPDCISALIVNELSISLLVLMNITNFRSIMIHQL